MAVQILSAVIVLVIVFYFLSKENRRQKKYLGKKVKLTAREKRTLERYKQEYEPIPPDERLSDLDRDKWELEDIAKSATEIVYETPIPTKRVRQNLRPGDLVKLRFVVKGDQQTEIERIWVRVIDKKDGLYLGELDNEPFDEILKPIETVWFHPNHVLVIDQKPGTSAISR